MSGRILLYLPPSVHGQFPHILNTFQVGRILALLCLFQCIVLFVKTDREIYTSTLSHLFCRENVKSILLIHSSEKKS